MPEFRCLGKTFQVSNADLGRAPDSVLSASWRIKGSQGVVDLTAWPEPDLEVFQAVLSCLQQRADIPRHRLAAIVRAVDYFAIPVELWPTGLLLMHRALEVEETLVTDIVKQLVKHSLNASVNPFSGAYSRQAQDSYFCGKFIIGQHSLCVETVSPKSIGFFLPPSFRRAVTEAAKAHCLDVVFGMASNLITVRVGAGIDAAG